MKHIFAAIVILAASFAAAEPLPVLYECNADKGVVLEEQFCKDLHSALEATENVIFVDKSSESYFHLTILPAARGGFLGVLITSNYVTPPFKPLELSAFSGIWMISPGADDEAAYIAASTLKGTFEWIEWARGKKEQRKNDPREMVCELGDSDD